MLFGYHPGCYRWSVSAHHLLIYQVIVTMATNCVRHAGVAMMISYVNNAIYFVWLAEAVLEP